MSTGPNPFSAAPSQLGYQYQVREALLLALKKCRTNQPFSVAIEALDDVVFESIGNPIELIQTKHHINATSTLTDASPDLWKTLRIWFEGVGAHRIVQGATYQLITTAIAPLGSVAALLRSGRTSSDVVSAQQKLENVAITSTNTVNALAYKAYLETTLDLRLKLLEDITVLSQVPPIQNWESEIWTELLWAADKRFSAPFIERLEGWWMSRVIKHLTSPHDINGILSEEIYSKVQELREQFSQESLPIDEDIALFELDDTSESSYHESPFVLQLKLFNAGKSRIALAINDYYRAFTQRSRWLRDSLVLVGELDRYENRLVDEWKHVFATMEDELGGIATEEDKRKAASNMLKWAETTTFPIRKMVLDSFVSRGSFHILADDLRVGWHPEFRKRLEALLSKAAQ